MSTKTESSETTEEKAPAKASSSSADKGVKYTKERLIADAYPLTGYPSHVLAGALDGRDSDLTVEQAVSAVEKFLNSEVKEA